MLPPGNGKLRSMTPLPASRRGPYQKGRVVIRVNFINVTADLSLTFPWRFLAYKIHPIDLPQFEGRAIPHRSHCVCQRQEAQFWLADLAPFRVGTGLGDEPILGTSFHWHIIPRVGVEIPQRVGR
mgnify:CR=1 FL=1